MGEITTRNIMWAGNLSNFSQPCPEWLKWKTTVKDIADWHMRRDQTEATRPSVTNRCLGLHASGFRRWFHSYSQQPLTTIRNQFGNTFFLWDQLLPVGPYYLAQWKQISFVDLLNGVHRVGPEGNLGCGSLFQAHRCKIQERGNVSSQIKRLWAARTPWPIN